MRRSIPQRVASVQVKVLVLAGFLLLLAGWWFVPGVATAALLVVAVGVGVSVRPVAELVVSRRRLSVAALLDPEGEADQAHLALEEQHRPHMRP